MPCQKNHRVLAYKKRRRQKTQYGGCKERLRKKSHLLEEKIRVGNENISQLKSSNKLLKR